MEKLDIARDWLPRYTGMPLEQFGTHILLTNFADYVGRFADQFDCEVTGNGLPMQSATSDDGISIKIGRASCRERV